MERQVLVGTEMVEQLCALANGDWIPPTEKKVTFSLPSTLSLVKKDHKEL